MVAAANRHSIDLPVFKEVMRQARRMIKTDIQALIIRDVMMVILLFHPFVSGLAMRAWKCTPVISSTGEPAKSFLDIDMTITCFTTSNWIGIAVFSGATMLLFSLGASAVLLFTLVRRREKLGDKATFKRFGILYSSWRPAFFFFGAFPFVRQFPRMGILLRFLVFPRICGLLLHMVPLSSVLCLCIPLP